MLRMILKLDVEDVGNALRCACCVCSWVGGCIDLVGCPLCGKIEWLKSLNISEGMFRIFNLSMVFVLDGAHVHCCMLCMFMGGCIDLPGSLALAFGHDHMSYGVYVMGGRVH